MNERLLGGLLNISLSRPRSVVLCWALAVLALTPFVLHLTISTTTDSVLSKEGESWRFYKKSLEQFDSDEVLVAAISTEVPFDASLLDRLLDLSRQIESLGGVRRVDSLATVPLVRTHQSGSIELAPVLGQARGQGSPSEATLRELSRSDPMVVDSLLSRDGRVAALNVHLESRDDIPFDIIVQNVRGILEKDGAWVSGVPLFRAEVNRRAGAEIGRFVALTAAIVSIVLYAALGSLTRVLVALAVGMLGTWSVLAALGGTGTPLTLITVVLPSLMLALGCAYSMHLMAAARRASEAQQLKAELSEVLAPTALSGLTTAIGFAAIASVQIDAVRQVGIFGAVGVLVVVLASLTVTPAALALCRTASSATKVEQYLQGRLLPVLLKVVERRSRAIVAGSVLSASVLGAGLVAVRVETDVTKWFPRGSDVRESYEEIRARLAGISPMNMVIRAREGPVATPEMLAAIRELTSYLNTIPEVGRATSIADPISQLHSGMTGERQIGVPQSQELLSQYLLLLESAPFLSDLITRDGTAATVAIRSNENGSRDLLALAAKAERWWSEHGPVGSTGRVTGIMFEFARAEHEIAMGQIRGIGIALVTIFVLMWIIFRSVRLAFLAMIPNVLPLVIVFGALGFADVPLDAGLLVSASLVFGIAVDNTIHLIAAMQRVGRNGLASIDALPDALKQVIVPVVSSSAAIGLGFLVLTASGFAFVRNLGALVVAVMLICCVADLVLLPAALRLVPQRVLAKWGEMPSFKLG